MRIRSSEDIREKLSILQSGLCESGTSVPLQFEYPSFDIIFLPQAMVYDDLYLDPALISFSGGNGNTNPNQRTYVAIRPINANDDKYGKITTKFYSYVDQNNVVRYPLPEQNMPITISWQSVQGASSYLVYTSPNNKDWYFKGATSSTSMTIYSLDGIEEDPWASNLDKCIYSTGYQLLENAFVPNLYIYGASSSSTTLNITKGIGETWTITTDETIGFELFFTRSWTIRWPGFSGGCTWYTRHKIRYKKSGEQNWIDTKTYLHQETWGSQWIGGYKNYSISNTLSVHGLERAQYVIELFDIYEYRSNTNYWFDPHTSVTLHTLKIYTSVKRGKLRAYYLILRR